jgi:hypothetical protein
LPNQECCVKEFSAIFPVFIVSKACLVHQCDHLNDFSLLFVWEPDGFFFPP